MPPLNVSLTGQGPVAGRIFESTSLRQSSEPFLQQHLAVERCKLVSNTLVLRGRARQRQKQSKHNPHCSCGEYLARFDIERLQEGCRYARVI